MREGRKRKNAREVVKEREKDKEIKTDERVINREKRGE